MERLPCAKVVCLSIYLSINRSIYISITIIYYLSMSVYLSTYLVPIQSSSAPTILSHHLRLITIGRFNMWFFRPLIPVNGGLKEEGVRNCVFAVFVALPVAKQASVFMRLWAANMRERLQREVPLAKQIHKNCGEGFVLQRLCTKHRMVGETRKSPQMQLRLACLWFGTKLAGCGYRQLAIA